MSTYKSLVSGARDYDREKKLDLLADLEHEIAMSEREKDKALARERLESHKAQLELEITAYKAQQQMARTLVETKGRLKGKELDVYQRSADSWNDAFIRLATLGAGKADAYFGRIKAGLVSRGPVDNSQELVAIRDAYRNVDVTAPEVLEHYRKLAGAYGKDWVHENLPDLTWAAGAEKGRRDKAVALIRMPIEKPDVELDVDEFLELTAPRISAAPPDGEVAAESGYIDDLKARRDRLEKELGSGAGAAGVDRLGGLTVDQAHAILSDPKFRAWAQDRGFKLGSKLGSGAYTFGKDDVKALRVAARQQMGKHTLYGGEPLEAGVFDVEEDVPVNLKAVLQPAPTPARVLTGGDVDGKDTVVYEHLPGGDIVRHDLVLGSADTIRKGGAGWTTPEQKAAYEADVGDSTPAIVGEKGGTALTIDEIKVRGKGGLDTTGLTDVESELTMPVAPPIKQEKKTTQVSGRRMALPFGGDPERDMQVLTDEGLVTLYRESKDKPWTVKERAPAPPKFGLLARRTKGDVAMLPPQVDTEPDSEVPLTHVQDVTPMKGKVVAALDLLKKKAPEVVIEETKVAAPTTGKPVSAEAMSALFSKEQEASDLDEEMRSIARKHAKNIEEQATKMVPYGVREAERTIDLTRAGGTLPPPVAERTPTDEAFRKLSAGATPQESVQGIQMTPVERVKMLRDLRRAKREADASLEREQAEVRGQM